MIAMFRKLAEAKKGKDLLAINYENGTPMLLIQNPDLVAEFMQKENEVCRKDLFTELPTDIGFIMKNGAHGLSRRQIFSKFFYPEKLEKFTPQIASTIKEILNKVVSDFDSKQQEFPTGYQTISTPDDGFKSFNVREILLEIFSKMVEEILFGSKRHVKIDGKSLPESVDLLFKYGLTQTMIHPANMLTGGLAGKFQLIECARKATELNSKIKKILAEEIDYRLKLPEQQLGVNVLDILIAHNRNATQDDILSKDEIISNCILFYVAGVDTSKNTSEFTLQYFARNTTLLESFNSQIASKISEESLRKYEIYEKNEMLQNFTKEALRLFSASSQLFPRLALKDFKLGKYSIRKGTNLNIFFNTFHHSDEVYQNCWKFEPERFKSISEGRKNLSLLSSCHLALGRGTAQVDTLESYLYNQYC